MKNKVSILVAKDGLRSYVTFMCEGDIWKWLNSNKKDVHTSGTVLDLVQSSEEKEFMYDTQLNKFLKRFSELKYTEIKTIA